MQFQTGIKNNTISIVIALYEKNITGMSYDYINNFNFEIENNLFFNPNDYDYISNYTKKYPNKYAIINNDSIFFWTMRDINALKRNRTFIDENTQNSIVIEKEKLDYYIYVDVFKRYVDCVPYYFGNCDVIINNNLFNEFKKYFILYCLFHNPRLRKFYAPFDFSLLRNKNIAEEKIHLYLKQLLEEHMQAYLADEKE